MTENNEITYIAKRPATKTKRDGDHLYYVVEYYRTESKSGNSIYADSKRRYIGRVVKKKLNNEEYEHTDYFVPNEIFAEIFPEAKLYTVEEIFGDGAVIDTVKKTRGRPRSNVSRSSIPKSNKKQAVRTDIEKVTSPFYHYVAKYLSEDIGLNSLLLDIYGEKSTNTLVALAAFYHEGSNAVRRFERWAKEHNLDEDCFSTSQDISKFFKELDQGIDDFREEWAMLRSTPNMSVIYDVTSHNSYADKTLNEFVEYGYSRGDASLPQMNFALLIDQDTGMPVNFDLFRGNTNDVTHFKHSFNKLVPTASENNVEVVCDSGCTSKEIFQELDKDRIKFTTLLREGTNLFDECVDQVYGKIIPQGKYLFSEEVYTMVLPVEYCGVQVDATVFYSHELCAKETKVISNKFLKALKAAEELNKNPNKELKKLEPYLNIKQIEVNGNVSIECEISEEKFKEQTKHCGIFVIINSVQNRSSSEILTIYRRRNLVEQMMHIIKNVFGCNAYRTHSEETSRAKALSIFISLILYVEFSNRLASIKKLENLTVLDAIKELHHIHVFKLKNGQVAVSPISSKAKAVLKAMGLTAEEVMDEVASLL